jgi:hypothetical protein
MTPSEIELADSFRVVAVNISNTVHSGRHLPTFRQNMRLNHKNIMKNEAANSF